MIRSALEHSQINCFLSKTTLFLRGDMTKRICIMTIVIWFSVLLHAQSPKIKVQVGHTGVVLAGVFSPDGNFALSGARDYSLKLWDVKSGKEIRTFITPDQDNGPVEFSPDGKYVISNQKDVWEILSGNKVDYLSGYPISFSQDGKYAISGSADNTLILWDLATHKKTRSFSGHAGLISTVEFNSNGKTAFSGSKDGTIKVWNVLNGKCEKTFAEHSDAIYWLTVSESGKYLLSASYDNTMKIWGIETGRVVRSLSGVYGASITADSKSLLYIADKNTLKSCDIESGKDVATFTGHSYGFKTAITSPDAKYVLSGSADGEVILWELSSGRKIRTLSGHSEQINSVAFSSDSRYAITGSDDMTLIICDLASGDAIHKLTGYSDLISSINYLPDGDKVVLGSWASSLKLWNATQAKGEKIFADYYRGEALDIYSTVALSRDGGSILTNTQGYSFLLWDLRRGDKVRTFTGHSHMVNALAISPDCSYALSGSSDNTLKLWDIKTSAQIRTFVGHAVGVTAIAYSPDGSKVISGAWDGSLKLWDVSTGKEIRTFSGHSSYVSSVCFSQDRKYAVTGSFDNSIKLWDVSTGKEVKTFTGHSHIVLSAWISPDSKYILSGSYDKTIRLWDISSGKTIRTFSEAFDEYRSLSVSPDWKHVIAGTNDGIIRYWNLSTGELVYSAIYSSDGEHLTWTSEGYFSGSELLARNSVYIQDGLSIIDIDQFYDVLYRPDLVEAKISGQNLPTGMTNLADILFTDGLPPIVDFLTDAGNSDNRDVTLRVKITDRGGRVGRVTIFIEGSPVQITNNGRGLVSTAATTKYNEYLYEALITLRYGTNRIECSAFNMSNSIESRRAAIELTYKDPIPSKPNLHLLTVAVDKYRDKALWLNYSKNDAEAIANTFVSQDRTVFESINIYALFDSEVTKDLLSAKFNEISSLIRPDDVFILYIAGHGVTNPTDGDYYFLPVDFRYTDSEAIKTKGISKYYILGELTKVPAQKVVLLFDTCNSGSFLDKPSSRGIAEKTAIDRLHKTIGRAVIVASTESQVALEGYQNHGVFTYAVLQGLDGRADFNKNGQISVSELSLFVENEVPELTYKIWGYEQIPQKALPQQDFPILIRSQ